jgi:hypothetical protein
MGLIDRAQAQYQEAIRVVPDRAGAYSLLAELAQRSAQPLDSEFTAALDALRPRYILGRQSDEQPSARLAVPTVFPNGWALAGFDLDEEALAAGPPVDLLLFWEAPPGTTPEGGGWVKAGRYWLQWQHVTNLAPNAGFTWGEGENGLPEGFIAEVYSARLVSTTAWAPHYATVLSATQVAAHERISTFSVGSPNLTSASLQLDNGTSVEPTFRLGLLGIPVPVDPGAIYLQAGTIRDAGRGANIGRSCAVDATSDEPSYIAFQRDDNPRGAWVHWAAAGTPLLDKGTDRCSLFILNYESEGPAQFTNVLFTRLSVP